MLGFGIIGCGMIAKFHARAIADVRGARLAACFDQVPAAADKLAEATGCKAHRKLGDLLADPAVHVVTIGTPSGAHLEPAVAAARAGKHVIVEKPLEITLRRCDRIIDACRQAGVLLSTIMLTWLMGPVVEVRAKTALLAHERIAVEDVALATVEFASGALGVIEASTAVYPGYLKRIAIHGNEGSAVVEEEDLVKWDFEKKKPCDEAIHAAMANRKSGGGGAADPAAIGHHAHTKQFQNVVQAIKKGTAPSVDGPEGRRSVEIILAFYKSAETGKAVKLPLAGDPVLKARRKGK